jgi:nucleoid-associated protein YgaU
MPDNPAKDPAGNEKVGPKKGGMLTGKNKWYVVGGLGIVAVLVFFFVSRSKSNAAGSTTATTGTQLDPSTQAALETALQGQAGSAGFSGLEGPAGPAGPTGPAGAAGAAGKPGTPGKPAPKPKPSSHPMVKSAGSGHFYTVKSGDTLSSIASRFSYKGGWQALYSANRHAVGSNPNMIHAGLRLKV